MGLGADFKYADRFGLAATDDDVEKAVGKVRRVRTLAGMKVFGQPIGTVITRDMIERARRAGKLKGNGGERRYGRYAPPTKSARPVRNARPSAKPLARDAGRPAARAAAKPAARPARRDDFDATLKRASYKDVLRMLEEVQNDDSLDDKEFDRRVEALLARGRALRPNKETKAPAKKPATKRAVATQKPSPKKDVPESRDFDQDYTERKEARIKERQNALVTEAPPKQSNAPRSRYNDAELRDVINVFMDAVEGAETEKELATVARYLSNEPMPVSEKSRIRNAIAHRAKGIKAGAAGAGAQDRKTPKGMSFVTLNQNLATAERALGRTDTTVVENLLRDVERGMESAELNDTQRDHLKALIGSLRERNDPKNIKSENRKLIRERIAAVDTSKDLQEVIDLLHNPQLKMAEHEREYLLDQAEDRSLELGIHVNINGGLDPLDWDSHPDKVKRATKKVDDRAQRYLLAGRKELGKEADLIRARERQSNPDQTAAGKAIARGVDLNEITDVDGMIEYIYAHPERFRTTLTDEGQGGAFSVFDMEQGVAYFFKHTNAGTRNGPWGNVKMFGEAANEVMSGKIGQAFKKEKWFPDVDFASTPDSTGNPVIRMDHLRQMFRDEHDYGGVEFSAQRRFTTNAQGEKIILRGAGQVRDPKNPLAIHLFDFLTNNTDRHDGNFAEVTHSDGSVTLVALDNGAAFHGFDTFVQGGMPDSFIQEPENIGYAEWVHHFTQASSWSDIRARAHMMLRETVRGYEFHKRDNEKDLAADADSVLKSFAAMDTDQIVAELKKRFPDMDGYEDAHLQKAAIIFQNRLRNITPQDVAKFILQYQSEEKGGQ